jgi:hypothetical protein
MKKLSDESGASCGTARYEVICHMPSDSQPEYHSDNCIGDENGCGQVAHHYDCGKPVETLVQLYCSRNGAVTPYQIYPVSDRSGGGCGRTTYMVACQLPIEAK